MKELILTKNLEDMTMIGSWLFQKSARTQRYYRRVLRDFLEFFPGLTLRSVEVTHLALFLKAYGEFESSTRNTYKNALSSFFTFATKAGYLPRNPALALDNLKTPDRIYTKVLSREQVEQMILK
ncbi:MAG: site-specific integrase, partial [Bdellovibrionales bacterium]